MVAGLRGIQCPLPPKIDGVFATAANGRSPPVSTSMSVAARSGRLVVAPLPQRGFPTPDFRGIARHCLRDRGLVPWS